ncbi:MAG: hypothetical protein ABI041_00875 [Bdellovibrionia bacterium]
MQSKSRSDLYRDFLEFVSRDMQTERVQINRRILNVFLWCFIFPLLTAASILLLVKFNFLPRHARNHADLLILVFPVFYSLYFLGSEVLSNLPRVLKKGGVASTLNQSLTEGDWRDRVCEGMARAVAASSHDWGWIIASFRIDLRTMRYRTKHLTALAGAVFFLLIRGIDSIAEVDVKPMWAKSPIFGWVDTSSDLSQFVGLTLFLVLLFLSGSQTNQSLYRYLNCASLLNLSRGEQERGKVDT